MGLNMDLHPLEHLWGFMGAMTLDVSGDGCGQMQGPQVIEPLSSLLPVGVALQDVTVELHGAEVVEWASDLLWSRYSDFNRRQPY